MGWSCAAAAKDRSSRLGDGSRARSGSLADVGSWNAACGPQMLGSPRQGALTRIADRPHGGQPASPMAASWTRAPALTPSKVRLPAMLVAACLFPPLQALADEPPRMPIPKALIGDWAGERVACAAPPNRLHLFRAGRTRHPQIYEGEAGYSCVVLNVRGRAPNYRLHLRCRAFGTSVDRRPRPVNQAAKLSGDGVRMEISMWDWRDGTPLRNEHLHRCRGVDVEQGRSRRPPGKDAS